MPHSKDLRCGAGWYDINVNHFFEWMEETCKSEIEVSENFTPFSRAEFEYHERILHDEIEERMNEFLEYRIFNQFRPHLDEDDRLPKDFESAYSYIYYHLLRLCKTRPTWYYVLSYTSECCAEEEPEAEYDRVVDDDDDEPEPEPEPKTAKKAEASREDNLKETAEALAKQSMDFLFKLCGSEDKEAKRDKAREYAKKHLIPMTRESMNALVVGDAIAHPSNITEGIFLLQTESVTAKTLKTDGGFGGRKLWKKIGFFEPVFPSTFTYSYQFILKHQHYEEIVRILGVQPQSSYFV